MRTEIIEFPFDALSGIAEATGDEAPHMDTALRVFCDFLHFGFLPQQDRAVQKAAFYSEIVQDESIPVFDPASAGSARNLAATILSERLAVRRAEKIRMGVSSGLDSRGLLGVALDVLRPEQIIAYTTGQTGNPDFDTARDFTHHILPTHFIIPTQDGTYEVDRFVEWLRKQPPGVARPMYGISDRVNNPMRPHSTLHSVTGYLGDSISGKRLNGQINDNWDDAVANFLRRNEVFRPSTKRVISTLLPEEYNPRHLMPDAPLLPAEQVRYDDQLDLCYRQNQRIRVSFPPSRPEESRGSDLYVTPGSKMVTVYDDIRWQKSYLLMADDLRLNQRHYRWMLSNNWPEIFRDLDENGDKREQPAETDVALSGREKLEKAAKTTLHTNWEALWLGNDGFNAFARTLIASLAERRIMPWVDIPGLLDEFDQEILGLGKLLWALLSLELNLRAGRLPEPDSRIQSSMTG